MPTESEGLATTQDVHETMVACDIGLELSKTKLFSSPKNHSFGPASNMCHWTY